MTVPPGKERAPSARRAATASPSPRTRAAKPARAGATARAAAPPRFRAIELPPWIGPALVGVAFIVLLVSCLGAPLGTPVADDYSFLARLRFQHPLDPFDTMGASFYWRPLSRQLYFSLIGPILIVAPWIAATFNAIVVLALGVVIYRIARRALPPPLAAAVAAFPFLSEPARVLIGWPSGAQHALASLGAALAIQQALAGRSVLAALAAFAGMLCHESAALALPVIPAIAWFRTRRWPDTIRAAAPAVVAGIVWQIGYAIARRHGVTLPSGTAGAYPVGLAGGLLGRAVRAAMSLEDVSGAADDLLIFGIVVLVLIGIGIALTPRGGARIKPVVPAIAIGVLWFLAGTLPLAYVLPDWNAWRDWTPALGLGAALTLFLALASPWLAAGFVALKLAGLLLSPVAPPTVTPGPPNTGSHMSFVRLVRLQRTVDSARRALTSNYPTLPKGAAVIYWYVPRLAEVGFQKAYAVQVWYSDSTIVWDKFGGLAGFNKRMDAMLQFSDDLPSPASVIKLEAMHMFQEGGRELLAEHYAKAESLFAGIERVQPVLQGSFYTAVLDNRAIVAFNQADYHRADSLNHLAITNGVPDANAWALAGDLAVVRNDRDAAIKAVRKCLLMEPTNAEGLRLAQILGIAGK